MATYRCAGEERASALGNRGPIRFNRDGSLIQDIVDAYWRCGFYVFTSVVGPEELGDIEADIADMVERLPSTKGSAIDALGSHLRGTNHVLRAAAADIFTLAISDEVVRASGAAQGYLTHWMVLGPFNNDRFNVGYDAVYPPEQEVDFAASYDGATSPARNNTTCLAAVSMMIQCPFALEIAWP